MAYGILKREYDFWMKERITPNGLNRYGYDMNTGNIEMYASMIRRRLAGLDNYGYYEDAVRIATKYVRS